ncbi:MAG TPA: hypothetical protein VGP93_04940 [Polyangiaceae bacterium]|nr:hypothetical protein [Polyangiaceae bacterium]
MRWLGLFAVAMIVACSPTGSVEEDGSGGSVSSAGSSAGKSGSGGAGGTGTAGSSTAGSATSGAGAGGAAFGGSSGTSGVGGSGGSSTHVIQACPSADQGGPTPGVWENITPAVLQQEKWCWPAWNDTCPAPGQTSANGNISTYGTNAVAIDPNDNSIVYLGTSSLGLFKTTNCGADWVHISTGTNGTEIDRGRNWSLVIDPTDSQVIYTTSGYGSSQVYKSTNGGVDWLPMLPDDIDTTLGMINTITMDPTNHLHLLASPHGVCSCMGETTDGGVTWNIIDSPMNWQEGDGQTMIDSATWFYESIFNGIYRTSDAGGTWNKVFNGGSGHVYQGADNTLYTCGGNGVAHSTDGVNWSVFPNSLACGGNSNGCVMITGDGENIFASNGGGNPPPGGYLASASEAAPATWTGLSTPPEMTNGGISIAYDKDHHILYSSNYVAGMWRLVTE